MSTVIAALDGTSAAGPVMETALRLGQLIGAEVEAVHVRNGPYESAETPELLTARSKVPLRVADPPVDSSLLGALGAPEVIAAVIGARATPAGGRPVGHTARFILEHTDKPVVIVPPDTIVPPSFHRLLAPLEGTEASSRPVIEQLWPLLVSDVELVVLHVFTDSTLPVMLDQPAYDLGILGKEFLTRHCPHASFIELRPGPVSARVVEVSSEYQADLVVLSWSQDSSAGRARTVQEVLSTSAVPVLLLPVAPIERENLFET